MRRLVPAVALLALVPACNKGQLVSITMDGAKHATSHEGKHVGDRMILAGDMHCHVLPPDAPYEVSRELPETLARAKSESLDFVVLTPHVPARFFMDDDMRGWVLGTQQQLRARINRLHPDTIVIPGFEYTDHRYGHVGASFADPSEVLAALSTANAQEEPARFFEMWLARGGILTINHPVNRSLKGAPFAELRYDLSWRGFRGLPVPSEVEWITTHAQAIETFNVIVTHLRDQFFVGEENRSLREAAHLLDRVARRQKRKIAAVGGSDSHGSWLRATTFVLAKERSLEGIRDAIREARTCVRGPEACSLQVRLRDLRERVPCESQGLDQGAWLGVGDSIRTSPSPVAGETAFLEGQASGGDVAFVVNGEIVATAGSGEIARIPVPTGRCSVVRAIVGRSWSSSVYVDCF